MKKLTQIAPGIVTSIGGFLDVGAIAAAVQAGTSFGFTRLWALVLGTICVMFLVEMSARREPFLHSAHAVHAALFSLSRHLQMPLKGGQGFPGEGAHVRVGAK